MSGKAGTEKVQKNVVLRPKQSPIYKMRAAGPTQFWGLFVIALKVMIFLVFTPGVGILLVGARGPWAHPPLGQKVIGLSSERPRSNDSCLIVNKNASFWKNYFLLKGINHLIQMDTKKIFRSVLMPPASQRLWTLSAVSTRSPSSEHECQKIAENW